MDWETFKTRLGKIQSPRDTPEYMEKFISAKNSIHLVIGQWDDKNFQLILDTVSILESRGAIREQDYIVTASWKLVDNDIALDHIAIHTTDGFMSQEDFIDIEMDK